MPRSSRSPRSTIVAGLVALVVGTLGASCGDDGATVEQSAGPSVVATTSIWADVVANVACDGLADVTTIVPVGGDPHGFEPSLADRGDMEAAALVVANGLGLEEGLADTLDAVSDAGTPVLRVGGLVDTIPYEGDDHEDGAPDHEDGTADHEGDDPHVWFDPTRVAAMLPSIADALVNDAGLDRTAVDACVRDYDAELAALDAEVADLVATLPADRRVLITSHHALGYFADRYGFTVIGTVIPAPSGLAETNPAQLEELAGLVEEYDVPAIFAETQHSTDDAEALAERVGDVEVITLFTGSLAEDGPAATYTGLVVTDAGMIVTALGREG